MKINKLIIAAAIVCAAAYSQAAQIAWGASSANYVTSDGVIQTAGTADVGTFVLVYLGTGVADWNNAQVVNDGSVSYGSGKSGSYARAGGEYSWQYADGTVSDGHIFGVMFKDDQGNLSKLQTTEGAEIETTFTVTGLGMNTYSGTFEFTSSDYTVGASVPEPTSGLLLLVGGALLALRRKQK